MLRHLQAGDLVVSGAGDVPIIERENARAVLQSSRPDALGGELRLVLAQRDAGRVDPELIGEIGDQGPPAAADVEKPISGLELQLLANVADFPLLRRLQRFVDGTEPDELAAAVTGTR